ncbi:MAG: hypothetical protein EOM90_04850, partial [Alphaproteobacteria bacterium]|nr:hypothetical protein [Alphaproteobacteria bacterium]
MKWLSPGTQWIEVNFTDSNSCNALTATHFPVTVTPGDSVIVTISYSTNSVCSGTPVTFTAVPTNPGTSPVYQWKVNGVGTGSNSPVFAYAPANG